jgi:hypothetical protein
VNKLRQYGKFPGRNRNKKKGGGGGGGGGGITWERKVPFSKKQEDTTKIRESLSMKLMMQYEKRREKRWGSFWIGSDIPFVLELK